MSQQKTELVRWVFRYSLANIFQSDKRRMATALDMSINDIERAVASEGARAAAPMFEKLTEYYARNGHSMDEILAQYKEPASPP